MEDNNSLIISIGGSMEDNNSLIIRHGMQGFGHIVEPEADLQSFLKRCEWWESLDFKANPESTSTKGFEVVNIGGSDD